MREYIIQYKMDVNSVLLEKVVIAVTLQDAVNIFTLDHPDYIIINSEGPYDIR
jgi:hypothetical protein